mmetsp:Transcript_3298/g.7759  ORF Transcript_3298/g.7759 Transcript_3298/m.7759 type:complete len:236 (+) Transcript_3298:1370-2077(+)
MGYGGTLCGESGSSVSRSALSTTGAALPAFWSPAFSPAAAFARALLFFFPPTTPETPDTSRFECLFVCEYPAWAIRTVFFGTPTRTACVVFRAALPATAAANRNRPRALLGRLRLRAKTSGSASSGRTDPFCEYRSQCSDSHIAFTPTSSTLAKNAGSFHRCIGWLSSSTCSSGMSPPIHFGSCDLSTNSYASSTRFFRITFSAVRGSTNLRRMFHAVSKPDGAPTTMIRSQASG